MIEAVAGVPVVPVIVNDTPARFVLDTGAERTIVTPQAVQRIGLTRDPWVATTMRGVSGAVVRTRNATPRTITLGGMPLRHHSLARDSSLVVATLSPVSDGSPIDGLLGRDFLSAFDVELDLTARTLTLFDVAGCIGQFLPWQTRYAEVPVQVALGSAFVVPVRIDGVALRALLDTGANNSLIAAPGMVRLGLLADSSARHTAAGVGPRPTEVQVHRFATMEVGPDLRREPTLLLAPARLVPIVDMLLGEDWVAKRPLWLSYTTHRLFIGLP